MESHVEYLRAKVLYNHLCTISAVKSDLSKEVSDRLTFATALSLLERPADVSENSSMEPLIGGISSSDILQYGQQPQNLSKKAMDALSDGLRSTLKNVVLYFHAAEAEELDENRLESLALSLDSDIQAENASRHTDIQELSSHLERVLDLYREATEVHLRLHASLQEAIETLPTVANAHHTASHDLLALTIETSLLKLSVVRARLRASLYDYSSPSHPRATIHSAVGYMHEKLVARHRDLDSQARDVQARLKEYEELLELVDGQGRGFAQVVQDLATVKRETEECRKDLRRLGWTES